MSVDLLFLNASNYGGQPIFPYAFVQVSALARSRGLTVVRCDLLGTDRNDWPDLVATLVAEHAPRMVGFHVRQADSQYLGEYRNGSTYFPVDDTRALISLVRGVTNVPVVVGGFGFTLHAQNMFAFVDADYGVMGGPDGFFDGFGPLAARDLSGAHAVPNLLFREGAEVRVGPHKDYGPLQQPEYDDAIFDELAAFYQKHGVALSQRGDRGDADVPVEVLRGCPCRCYFCTEPSVKGRRIKARDLDAIMADVAFLAARDVRVVWFICSELNMGGMAFALALTERMAAFNAGRQHPVLWRAYAMPKPGMSREQLTVMMASGYLPGWNEFASFDDVNLRACRMPYRAADAVAHYRTILDLTADPAIYRGEPPNKFEMFLGNAFMTPAAMRTTLEVIDREGFSRDRFYGDAVNATRVYALDGTPNCGSSADFSIGPDGRKPVTDLLHPTFHYAPALLDALGTEADVDSFIAYAAATFMTRNYQVNLDVPGFFVSNTTPAALASCLAAQSLLGLMVTRRLRQERAPDLTLAGSRAMAAAADALGEQVWETPTEASVGGLWPPGSPAVATAGRTLMTVLLRINHEPMLPVWGCVGLASPEDRQTPYRIMRRLYERFDSIEAVLQAAADHDSASEVTGLLLRYFLFANNVRFVAAYRPLLYADA